ncbi:MAG: carbohydrate kinase [Clostridiales bacterium]|nr:MAG: carbohydrate kinase [Clostridiales bacterium]
MYSSVCLSEGSTKEVIAVIDVACIGNLVADVITKPVDKVPEAGLLERVDSIETFSGGCAMNAGIDMAKIGIKTAVLGKIGNDSFGAFLKDELVKYGVDVDGIVVDNKTQTSASVVLSSSTGERSFLHCVGANGTYDFNDVNFDVIQKSKIVFVAGTMLLDAFDGDGCARTLKKAREMCKMTVLDTAWDSKNRWMSLLEPCLQYVDVFMPSIDEAAKLAGTEDLDKIADCFFDKGVKHVVIKNGKHGAYIRETKDSDPIYLPTYTKEKVVDTTGAGDSFCAGFLTGLAKGFSFKDCGKLANAVGTFCIMAKGASTGIKSYEEICEYMRTHEAG